MRIRKRRIGIYLNDAEEKRLKEQAELCGLMVGPYLRNLIIEKEMKARPQEEWAELLRQTSGIAININQIAKKVNINNSVAIEQLNLLQDMLSQIWNKLMEF